MQHRREIAGQRQDLPKIAPRAAAIAALLLTGVAASSARAQPCADVTPPVLVITSPARGETIEQGGTGDDTVVVSGFAQDVESNLVSLTIDGQEQLSAPATGMVPFAVPTPSPWGLSIVTASAEDACGNRAALAQSYLRSGAYFPASTSPHPDATVHTAIRMHLNGSFLDDHDRSDPDDLTTLANDAIGSIDWNSIPNPLLSQGLSNQSCSGLKTWFEVAYDVEHGSIQASNARLTGLDAVAGGVAASAALDTLHVPLSAHVTQQSCVLGQGPVTVGPLTVTGSVDSSNMSAKEALAFSIASGEVQASTSNVSVDAGSLTVSLDCGSSPAFVCNAVNSITNGLVDLFRSQIDQKLAAMLSEQVAPKVVHALNELRLHPAMGLVGIDTSTAFESVSADAGGIDLEIAAQLRPRARGADIPPDAGAIRRYYGSFPQPSVAADGYALGEGVSDDLVNELLWANWYGGGFDLLDLRAEAQSLGFTVESLSIQANLPPVLQPGPSPGVADIGVGDLRVHATVDPSKLSGSQPPGLLSVDFYVSALLDGRFGSAPPSHLRFDADSKQVASQILSASDRAQAEAVRPSLENLATTVEQAVVDRVLGGLVLPSLDVGGLGVGLPGTLLGLGDGEIDRPGDDATRLASDVALYAAEETLGIDASTCIASLSPNPGMMGVGYLFTAAEPISVTALGEYAIAESLPGDVVVALYDMTAGGSEQDLLVEKTLPAAQKGEPAAHSLPIGGMPGLTQDVFYHRALLESPVQLQVGRQYGIVAWGDGGGVLERPAGASVADAIHYDQGLLGNGVQSNPGNGMIQDLDGSGELATLGATFEFTPEPAPLASALVAIAAIRVARRLRGRA